MTPKQQRFIEEYLVDLNATQAAIRAGYSESTAGSVGFENLTKPEIAAAVRIAMDERSERTKITQDRILTELARIAFIDPRKVMSWGPNGVKLKESADLEDDDAAVIAEASESITQHGGSMKIKLHDKVSALTLLMRHQGMLNDKVQIDFSQLSDEERAERAAALLERARTRRDGCTPISQG